jgi:ribonuclease P protein component
VTHEVAAPEQAGARPTRLSRTADVQRVLRRGRSRSGDLLAIHALTRPDRGAADRGAGDGEPAVPGGTTRMTVVASRRVGGAVRRNRAKRLLREAARTRRWRPGLDVVLVARAGCGDSDLHRVNDELEALGERLGVFEAPR